MVEGVWPLGGGRPKLQWSRRNGRFGNGRLARGFAMGIEFDRILDAFDGPFQKLAEFAPLGSLAKLPDGG